MPLEGSMLDSGRGGLAMPSVEARGLAVVAVAQATLAPVIESLYVQYIHTTLLR